MHLSVRTFLIEYYLWRDPPPRAASGGDADADSALRKDSATMFLPFCEGLIREKSQYDYLHLWSKSSVRGLPPRCVYGGANSVDGVYHSGERTAREPEKVSYSNQFRCHIPPLRRHRPHLSLYTLKGQVMFRGKTSPSAIDTAPHAEQKRPLYHTPAFPSIIVS